jgi:hypothetical protein
LKASPWISGNASLHACQLLSLRLSRGNCTYFDCIRCLSFSLFQFTSVVIQSAIWAINRPEAQWRKLTLIGLVSTNSDRLQTLVVWLFLSYIFPS